MRPAANAYSQALSQGVSCLMTTRLEALLKRIAALPPRELTELELTEDILADAECERDMLEVEYDRLRGVLSEALAIVDNAARETLLDRHPSHAFAVLTEEEQNRLYALLKGEPT